MHEEKNLDYLHTSFFFLTLDNKHLHLMFKFKDVH